ncbi:vitamin K epoxide reductase family protein [Flagellimonas oceanensis]|uniref:vitamin K epoxide reductase family protein n=1 Tax=Flagellimonas oceanensis TaxID=2499163 RepID=UPI000F8C3D45|nr:vitamin K epoxide reductase family protein [Allomuricauda oceanensis]
MDNCTSVTKNLLTSLGVKFTNQFLDDTILSHSDHPSLLCISDAFSKYGINTMAVRVDFQKLKELPMPCIVQFSDYGGVFYSLKSVSDEQATYLDQKGKPISIPTDDFQKRWKGVCLLAETTENSGEPGIEKRISQKRTVDFFKWVGLLFLVSWLVLVLLDSQSFEGAAVWSVPGYFVLKLVGLTMGIMLLWYEVDKYNPTLQSFCSGDKRVDCNAVLSSKYAKLFNEKLSLGLIGFSYFFGTLLYLLINGFSKSSLAPLAYLSYASIPVVLISLYYQGVVIKQWCKFCLVVQAVLVLETLTASLASFHLLQTNLRSLPLLVALLLLPIPVWSWLKPLLENGKELNLYKRGLKKIKNNPNVLNGLLVKNRKIETRTDGLGISFVNKDAKYNLIKVCNPYCGPCAKAHPVLDDLLREGKINLQVLFTASTDEGDRRNKPVKHFLALDEKDNIQAHEAMDSWYLAEEKNYEQFAKKYELNGELLQQDHKILAMKEWCNAEKITHTPTIFINGYELPKEYSVDDLREALN